MLSTNLLSLVQESVASSRASRDLPGKVAVTVDVAPTIEVNIEPVQMQQVLINLLRNASSAMGGKGALTISARVEGRIAELAVSDSGPGLSTDALESLFTAFAPSASGGLGIGLSLARTIVEAQGGTIHASNRPEGGAVFCLKLPLG